jgi:bifunctional non-homologous end joining protein LigD
MLMRSPLARERRRPAGFVVPCAPTLRETAPSGPQWIHEIKHDGFRIIARKEGGRVRLWSRNGLDWSADLAAITVSLRALPADRLVIDGEAVAHCAEGLPDFHGLLGDGAADACLFAFDVLSIDGEDLRRLQTLERKAQFAKLLRKAPAAIRYVEHMEGDGPEIYRHATRLGLEGIVSKRRERRLQIRPMPLMAEGQQSRLRAPAAHNLYLLEEGSRPFGSGGGP